MTEISRRNLLKGGAALSATAAAAIGASVALAEIGAPLAAPAAEVVATTSHQWSWWISHSDGEIFTERFDSYEVAKAVAQEEGGMIAECLQQDFSLELHGDHILELLYSRNEDLMGEDGDFLTTKPEEVADLGKMVSAAVQAWAKKHNINTTAWVFADTRGEEHFPYPEDSEHDA